MLRSGVAPAVDFAAQIQNVHRNVSTLQSSLASAVEASLDKRLPGKLEAVLRALSHDFETQLAESRTGMAA
eukprot:3499755-Pyramimonas_sp.AAC.1